MKDDAPPLFTPAAQWTCAALVAAALALTAWQSVGKSPWSARPLPVIPGGAGPIDLNAADEERLAAVPGVGPALAGRIVAHRQEHGTFRAVDELRAVKGIGPATLERVRPFLHVADDDPPAPVIRGARPDEPASGKKPPPDAPLDVNEATEEQLRKLPGVGPVLAGRIVGARGSARFETVDDLRKVKGIGAKTLEKLRPFVRVGR